MGGFDYLLSTVVVAGRFLYVRGSLFPFVYTFKTTSLKRVQEILAGVA